ncbi:hypothetical protein Pyn_05634 [Prunus yedoensis var. nudiflora]|uniref:Uncharacterized protein n=1 Tax=Prunus yedoensis var. nudiflora TaxID=2094558 RepID=A0A314YJ64_PRUYE|nr:hypothetical protein Pyn_05634 [Prunus yedoensis var. nudiflora]
MSISKVALVIEPCNRVVVPAAKSCCCYAFAVIRLRGGTAACVWYVLSIARSRGGISAASGAVVEKLWC